jgi:peptidyl-prolyl isomerase E (cyclophilin E)
LTLSQERNKGFAFVEFEDPDDAAHALDNMSEAEFFGKVLKINYARSGTVTKQGGRAGA